MYKTTLKFGKLNLYGTGKRYAAEVTVELRKRPVNYIEKDGQVVAVKNVEVYEFAASGAVWNSKHTDWVSGGQNLEELNKYLKHNKLFQRVYQWWKIDHLNTMNAGTIKQDACLEANGLKGEAYSYDAAVECLKANGLYEDNGYRYGSAWVARELSDNVVKAIKNFIEANNAND